MTLCSVAVCCSILGNFIVLKNQAMVIDAMAHAILLGIVLGYFLIRDLSSPILLIFAALFGMLTNFTIELLLKSQKFSHDSATGVVFPLFFSMAIILISMFAKNVHLDVDAVLMGELLFVSLETVSVLDVQVPVVLLQIGSLLVLNLLFLTRYFRELQLMAFDDTLAKTSGIFVDLLQQFMLFLVALTAVVSFHAVGTIAVIALFVGPAMTALLVSWSLKTMIIWSIVIAIVNSIVGMSLAIVLDLNISGATSFMALIIFFVVYIWKAIINKRFKGMLTLNH